MKKPTKSESLVEECGGPLRHANVLWFGLWFWALALGSALQSQGAGAGTRPGAASVPRPVITEPAKDFTRNLSLQASVAVITENRIGDIFSGEISAARGDAGGQLYSLMLQWTAHEFQLNWFGRVLRPRFEPYATLTLVDENGGSFFPDYNAGAGFRWVDFPWDRWLDTSLFVGIGLTYSSQVYAIDRQRHPGSERSHWKFDWPIQLTLALPKWPQHQLVLLVDHQSGGHIFDRGGVNSIGLGYRFEF